MKPYHEEPNITIYNCDYREMLGEVMSGDLLMTDPPYGINVCKMNLGQGKRDYMRGDWDKERGDIKPLWPFVKKAGRRYACIWGGNFWGDILPVSEDWLIWKKFTPDISFSQAELAWCNFGRYVRYIEHAWNEEKLHPTQKPLAVIKWAIKQAPDDCRNLIVDPFMGSGTTLRAAKDMGRPAIGWEIEEKYCEIAVKRLAQQSMFGPVVQLSFQEKLK
jgi:site-specific DNA-methyltransferase (adenine-specific)